MGDPLDGEGGTRTRWGRKPKYFINEPCFGINSIVLVDMQDFEAYYTECGYQIPVRTVNAPGGGDHHIHSLDTTKEGLQRYDPQEPHLRRPPPAGRPAAPAPPGRLLPRARPPMQPRAPWVIVDASHWLPRDHRLGDL